MTSQPLPRTRSCFVCGIDNPHGLHARSRLEGDAVVLDHAARPEDGGYAGRVHGGLLMTLLDEVMAWAAIGAAGKACVAAELTARLLAPVEAGAVLRVEGRVRENRRRIIETTGIVRRADGRVAARATGRYVPMPDGQAALCAEDFVDAFPPPAAGGERAAAPGARGGTADGR